MRRHPGSQRPVTKRIGVAIMSVTLLIFMIVLGIWAWGLIQTGEPVPIGVGVVLVIIGLLGLTVLYKELSFASRASKLGDRLEAQGAFPTEKLDSMPSGRFYQEDGDKLFEKYAEEVKSSPEDWSAWFKLGLAYDAAGDRKRGLKAVRRAIELEKAGSRKPA